MASGPVSRLIKSHGRISRSCAQGVGPRALTYIHCGDVSIYRMRTRSHKAEEPGAGALPGATLNMHACMHGTHEFHGSCGLRSLVPDEVQIPHQSITGWTSAQHQNTRPNRTSEGERRPLVVASSVHTYAKTDGEATSRGLKRRVVGRVVQVSSSISFRADDPVGAGREFAKQDNSRRPRSVLAWPI